MMIPSLLIVTDRGGLRAYKVERNPNRAPGLHLMDSFEAQEAHGRYDDKVTDRAGNFKASGAPNQQTGGAAVHNTIDMENDRRACKHVAARINELVEQQKPESWVLAVPPTIKKLLIEHLSDPAVKHLTETTHADLLRAEPANIASHFASLKTA